MSSPDRGFGAGRRLSRSQEELAQQMEDLGRRLAESREAIVRLLAEGEKAPTALARPADAGPGVPGRRPFRRSGTMGGWLKDERRRMAAIVLLAVGAVALLTALVSMW